MVAPLIGAALIGAGATIASGLSSAYGQHKANKANRRDAQKQMDFQRDMANTQYTRSVDDLRRAGLNPLLAVPGGAAVPSGASSRSENTLEKGVSSALQARRIQREFAAMDSQIASNETLALKQTQEVETAKALEDLYRASAAEARNNIAKSDVDPKVILGKLLGDYVKDPSSTLERAYSSAARHVEQRRAEYNRTVSVPSGSRTSNLARKRSELSDYVDANIRRRRKS